MPPKTSNLHHITFHFYRSAILLSLPANTTIESMKEALMPALRPLATIIPVIPSSAADIQLWELASVSQEDNAEKSVRCIESEPGIENKTITQMGWGGWKTALISFRSKDGSFEEPIYTIPNAEEDEINGSEA